MPSAAPTMIPASQSRCGHPVGRPELLEPPEPRPHRPEVADRLVRDGAGPDLGVPEGGGVREEPLWVEVEVRLRVGHHTTRSGDEQGSGHHEREATQAHPLDAPGVFGRGMGGVRRDRGGHRGRGRVSAARIRMRSVAVRVQVSVAACSRAPRLSRSRSDGSRITRTIPSASAWSSSGSTRSPRLPVDHGIGVARDPGGDRRRAAGTGLGEGHPPALSCRGGDDRPGTPVEVEQLLVGLAADEADEGTDVEVFDQTDELALEQPFAHDHELEVGDGRPSQRHRLEQTVVLLDGHEPAHRHQEGMDSAGATGFVAGIDAGRDHVHAIGVEPQLVDELGAR